MPRTPFLFPTFAGGLIDGLANDTAPEGGLRVCKNADFADAPVGGITLRHPTTLRSLIATEDESKIPHSFPADFYPLWLFRFRGYETDNWPYLLVAHNGAQEIDRNLRWLGTFTEFDRSIVARHTIFNENKVYFIGGLFPTVLTRDSGNVSVREMGLRSSMDFNWNWRTSGGFMTSGKSYSYQLILTDENGHRSAPLPFADAKEVYVGGAGNDEFVELGHDTDTPANSNSLPTGSGQYKYLYRTPAYDAPRDINVDPPIYYLVTALDSTDPFYDDKLSDANLVTREVLDLDANIPPEDLSHAVIHNGIMWGFVEDSSVLRYTPQFDYENWPEINAIPIGDPDYLVALAPIGDRIMIFKKNKIFALWGTNIGNFDYREISSIYGTKIPSTIKTIDDNRMIFMDGQKRVIMYSGGTFSEISKTIKIPRSTRYWASLFKDYYVLWYFDNLGMERDTTPVDDIRDPDNPPPPPPPPPPPWEPHEMEIEYLPNGDPRLPEDDENLPPEGWEPPEEPHAVAALVYHIPSGVWAKWEGVQGRVPERPDRSVDNLVFWNGTGIEVLGKAYGEELSQQGELEIRTLNTDCGLAEQKKSFKEVELYFEYLDNRDFNGAIGQLELIVDDGKDTDAVWQQTITYDTDNPQNRVRFRLSNGANGRRASLRFIGNQWMNRFALMQAHLYWQPRGTPTRG